MNYRFFMFFLVISLNAPSFSIHAINNETNQYKQIMTSIQNKYQHLKACLQGKKPCSTSDFAIFSIALISAYASFITIRAQLLPSVRSYKVGYFTGTRKNLIERSRYEMVPLSQIEPTMMHGRRTEQAIEFAKRMPHYIDPGYWAGYTTRKTIETGQRAKDFVQGVYNHMTNKPLDQ